MLTLTTRAIRTLEDGPLGREWILVVVFVAQFGHLVEHVMLRFTGSPFIGPAADSVPTHFSFNAAIAVLVLVLVARRSRNPWVYPLAIVCVLHAFEHLYIFAEFLTSANNDGAGLFAAGGALGVLPLRGVDLHNLYNGLEIVFMTCGLWYEAELLLDKEAAE